MTSPKPDNPCPCGANFSRAECCGPILDGAKDAPTAESLMRARYSAFVEKRLDFIKESLTESALKEHDEGATRQWAEQSKWLGLKVLGTKGGGVNDERGEVEFAARYAVQGRPIDHHENAIFVRVDGKWKFLDAAQPRVEQVVNEGPRIGRNDPCPCGSGKKAKKCCA